MVKLFSIMGLISLLQFVTGCSDKFSFNYGYNVSKGKVYYKQPFPQPLLTMDEVDVMTFKVVSLAADSIYSENNYYATDKNNVYYMGYLVAGGHGPSFQHININYAKDKGQCYYRGEKIPGADPATFIIKSDDYAMDKAHIFHRTITVDDNTSIFEIFNGGRVVHTANTVSVFDKRVTVPVKATFKYLSNHYYAINDQVYFWDDAMEDGDSTGFIALDDFYSMNNKHVYYRNKIITNADRWSYKQLTGPYAKDKDHVFFFEKIVTGADPDTFEILNADFQCARDKYAVYHEDKKITNATAADLANKNHCNNCTPEHIFFAEGKSSN